MEYRIVRRESYLEHHGILGMKWGIRRFQNEDGTLTAEGKKRYNNSEEDPETKARNAELEKIKRLKTTSPSKLTDDELSYLQERRKAERRAVDYGKNLKKLQKKKAKDLTDGELQYLLQRKNDERTLKKREGFIASLLRESMMDVAKPALIATGKAWMVSKYSKDSFKTIMDTQMSRAFGYTNSYSGKKNKNNNSNDNGNNSNTNSSTDEDKDKNS